MPVFWEHMDQHSLPRYLFFFKLFVCLFGPLFVWVIVCLLWVLFIADFQSSMIAIRISDNKFKGSFICCIFLSSSFSNLGTICTLPRLCYWTCRLLHEVTFYTDRARFDVLWFSHLNWIERSDHCMFLHGGVVANTLVLSDPSQVLPWDTETCQILLCFTSLESRESSPQ